MGTVAAMALVSIVFIFLQARQFNKYGDDTKFNATANDAAAQSANTAAFGTEGLKLYNSKQHSFYLFLGMMGAQSLLCVVVSLIFWFFPNPN